MSVEHIRPVVPRLEAGGEATLAAMDDNGRWNIGRKTYQFVRRCMRDPVLRAQIKTRAAEIRAQTEQEGVACT